MKQRKSHVLTEGVIATAYCSVKLYLKLCATRQQMKPMPQRLTDTRSQKAETHALNKMAKVLHGHL